jgi:hypothetical protein
MAVSSAPSIGAAWYMLLAGRIPASSRRNHNPRVGGSSPSSATISSALFGPSWFSPAMPLRLDRGLSKW